MNFASPLYLLLLLLAAGALVLFGLWVLWRASVRRRFGATTPTNRSRLLTYAPPALLIVALAAVAIAAARPQIGHKQVRAEDRGIDLVIVLDVSQSMISTDAQPSRLGRSQLELGALLDRLQGDHVGLVVFARQPFVRSPLTSDVSALHRIVDGIDRERSLVEAGSDLGAAIRGGQRLLANGQARSKVMLIVSDGEDHGTSVSSAVSAARRDGIIIYTAGAGSPSGAAVLDADPLTRELRPRLDASAQPVITHLDEPALRAMADAGGGRYVPLNGDGRPLAVLASEFATLPKTTFGVQNARDRIERFQIFAVIALILLAAEVLLPWGLQRRLRLPEFNVRRWLPLAGAGLFVGAICSGGIAAVNRAGNQRYAAGDYDAALAKYQQALAMDASHPELHYNTGNALDQLEQYDRAIEEAKRALPAQDDDTRSKIEYSVGNHDVGAGQLQDAIEAYKRALLANPNDADAKHNLEIIQSRLNATPTPQPSPTPTTEGTPRPNNGTPDAGDGTPGSGTPTNTAGNSNEPPAQEAERQLDEALRGIDKQFSQDEALRVLDLLQQANEHALEPSTGTPGRTTPDY